MGGLVEASVRLLIYMNGDRMGAFSEDGVAFDNRMKEVSDSVGSVLEPHVQAHFRTHHVFQRVKLEDMAVILGHKGTKTTLRILGLNRVDYSSHMNMIDFGDDEDD